MSFPLYVEEYYWFTFFKGDIAEIGYTDEDTKRKL